MRFVTGRIICLLVVALGLSVPAMAQARRIQSNTAYTDKFGFYYETYLDPGTPELDKINGGVIIDGKDPVIHRFLFDSIRHVYVGYNVSVEVLAEPNTYRLTFGQLTMSPGDVQRVASEPGSSWTQVSTSVWGAQVDAKIIRGGEVLALNFMTNIATGQKITDYVTVQEPPRPSRPTFENGNTPRREFAFAPGPARDFRVDDAELRIQNPRLSINGKLDPSTASLNVEASGPIVTIYVANRGRFLLSLTPHLAFGFKKAGEVRGSTLTFKVGNDTYNLVAGAPIAPRDAAFNLYVLHQPAWKPTYPFADTSHFILGAQDRPDATAGRD